MSSAEENGNSGRDQKQAKKTRMRGACDTCRQKKIRCDSAQRPGKRCTRCVELETDCTHIYMSKKMGPRYRSSRKVLAALSEPVSLSALRDKMDPVLKTILQQTYQAPTNAAVVRETLISLARYARTLEASIPADSLNERVSVPPPSSIPSLPTFTSVAEREASALPESELSPGDQSSMCALADNLKRSLVLTASNERSLGPSSSVSFVATAKKINGVSRLQLPACPQEIVARYMRPLYWSVHPWEVVIPPSYPPYEFPDPDLMHELIELYFVHCNSYVPLLHRPTFEKNIKAMLHLSDSGFGGTVLVVCALASRYCNDPRVLLDGTESLHSSGYKWFRQVRHFNFSLPRAPSLSELQTISLAVLYLQGSSTPEKGWYLTGLGLRASQDIGLNRKAEKGPTVEGELRKRAFLALLLKETVISAAVGRSPSVQLTDFNLDFPVDCDDEYWENSDPALAFQQPAGKPSKVAFFNTYLLLLHIQSAVHRCFYSVKQADPLPGISTEEWDRSTRADIDSSLNAWIGSVPEHLRWDPRPSDPIFFNQSTILHAAFYYTQILVHRPFIGNREQSNTPTPSLSICVNAAKACISIMETHSRNGSGPIPHLHISLFSAGLMLLLSIWKQIDTEWMIKGDNKELNALLSCIRVLKTYERRWHFPGRFCDMLMALLATKGVAIPLDFASDVPDVVRQYPTSNSEYGGDSPEASTVDETQDFDSTRNFQAHETFTFPLRSTELSDPSIQFEVRNNQGLHQLQESGVCGLSDDGQWGAGYAQAPAAGMDMDSVFQFNPTDEGILAARMMAGPSSGGYQWEDLMSYIDNMPAFSSGYAGGTHGL